MSSSTLSDTAHAPPGGALDDAPAAGRRAADGLSNDYLNHFNEVLMLVEIAADAPEIVEDLKDWRPISYPDYFACSQLRRAPQARAAYDSLTQENRAGLRRTRPCHGPPRPDGDPGPAPAL